jgi:hypothetical protein
MTYARAHAELAKDMPNVLSALVESRSCLVIPLVVAGDGGSIPASPGVDLPISATGSGRGRGPT